MIKKIFILIIISMILSLIWNLPVPTKIIDYNIVNGAKIEKYLTIYPPLGLKIMESS